MGKDTDQLYKNESQIDDIELPFLNLSKIMKAKHDFSFDNKLGEGDYGLIYKGVLPDGKEVDFISFYLPNKLVSASVMALPSNNDVVYTSNTKKKSSCSMIWKSFLHNKGHNDILRAQKI
ncbi:unnamed protein product [Lactuca saligna]|uniref:Protein kinase domain-containing protein n=1 Tax=Lactuca saligna TaxID=75948 RepID=A0AA35Z4F0_LACSI|nr:unnamed protein product [Lactuca saligna]